MIISRKKLLVIGSLGAQLKYVLDIEKNKDVGVLTFSKDKEVINNYNFPVIGKFEDIELYQKEYDEVIICHPDPLIKREISSIIAKYDLEMINCIHPTAIISATSEIGRGNIIGARSILQPYSKLGNFCMIHAGVIIEHDCLIDNFVNIGPGAKLAGWVTVGFGSFIYTGATIIPQIHVGMHSTVGAGSVVVKNVRNFSLVKGVPAVEKEYKNDY